MNNRHMHAGLALVRLQLGITQQELADSIGISRSLLAMAETGKRSLPAHAMPLLVTMEKLSRQVQPVEKDNEKKQERLSASLIYNRVNKRLKQRNAAGHSLLRAAATATVQQGGDDITTGITAGANISQPSLKSIPEIPGFSQLLWSQAIQKTCLTQQLQHRLRERKAAGVKGQELTVFLNYTNTMIAVEDKRMNSLRIPVLKQNAAIRKAKLEYKKLLLQKQLLRFDAPALLRRELQINILERRVNELDGLLSMLNSFSASATN